MIQNSKFIIHNSRSGQVMILSVMMLGGILLSGAAIAGLLMLYQIKSANDIVNSAKAVFAADAELENVSWCSFKGADLCSGDNPLVISFDDGTVYSTSTYVTPPGTGEIIITSRGYAANGSVVRSLETIFETGP